MSTAQKYLLRTPLHAVADEPERLSEPDALKIIVSATGGAACPFHEVSPVANHLCGPVAAVPPEGHPRWSDLGGQTAARSSRAVNDLIIDACGLGSQNDIRCIGSCDSDHPLQVTMRHLSQGRIIRAHHNTTETQVRLAQAMRSGDVDRLLYAMEPRLDALKMLVDRARCEHGGDLPEVVIQAAVLVAKTLTGPTRWDIRTGYRMWDWPTDYRIGVAFELADSVMKHDFVHDAVIRRLIEGL